MGQIEDFRIFAFIVEQGSISRAASKSNIAKSAISRRLALLEDRYQAKLIDRRPGFWKVTQAGDELYRRAKRIIEEVDEIDQDFVSTSADLSGPLFISVPRDFGLIYLHDMLTRFKISYPQIMLTVDFDDRVVDLTTENYDLSIRISPLTQSNISTSQIGIMQHALYASPQYLQTRSEPEILSDLHEHQLLCYGADRRAAWEFVCGKKQSQFEYQPFLKSNSGLYLLNATLEGLGICRLPDFIVESELENNKLVRVLPKFSLPDWGIYVMHSQNHPLNRRMRVFLDEIKNFCLKMN